MPTVYITAAPNMGLGNSLFVLCAAIYYCELYGYTLELVKTDALLFGTSNMFNKSKCYKIGDTLVPYNKTIFGKLTFIDKLTDQCIEIHNDYTSKITDPQNKNILITGYNQNLDLFRSIMSKIPKYINIDDAVIKTYIFEKYGDIQNATMLGIRIGNDFKHMKKITPRSYFKALKYLENNGNITDQIYVIGDMPTSEYFKENNFKEVVECDIIQFYFGTMCKNYVLSESTFHLWMAYLGTDFGEKVNKTVICFNDTDVTNRHFHLDNWIRLDYTDNEISQIIHIKSKEDTTILKRQYTWESGYIIFNDSNNLQTLWGDGNYKIIDKYVIEASWRGHKHILLFNSSFTQYTSVRFGDFDIVRGTLCSRY